MSNKDQKSSKKETEVPLPIQEDLSVLTALWKKKRGFGNQLFEKFSQADNPYAYLFELIWYGNDSAKKQLTAMIEGILKDFNQWVKQKRYATRFLTLDLKMFVLDSFLGQKNVCSNVMPAIVNVYEMDKDAEDLKKVIDHHLARKSYKQVCYAVIALNLQHCYTFEEIVYPLFSQDKISLVYDYLKNHPDLQLHFAQSLDKISSCRQLTSDFLNSMDLVGIKRAGHKDCRWMQKMLSNFIKSHKIPLDKCPNLVKTRSFGALNYLFHKHFTDGSMNRESWKEMALATVAGQPLVQAEMLTKLVCLNEFELALEMADLLKMPTSSWPPSLVHYWQEYPNRESKIQSAGKTEVVEEVWDDQIEVNRPDYLTLRLSENDIVLVNTPETFETCLEDISVIYDVVGIDAEWRPSMGISVEVISIIQLATWDNVFLLDIPALTKCLNKIHWDRFIENFFCNCNILKIGYGLHTDLGLIRKVIKGTKDNWKFSQILDFVKFFPYLTSVYPDIAQHLTDGDSNDLGANDANNRGLSKLCLKVLGKPLNKEEQFSDWERRPLRPQQITYAALDAYCLLLLHEKLCQILMKMDLDLQAVIKEYFAKPSSQNEKIKHTAQPQQTELPKEPPIQYPPTPISEFKVLVDNCLSGLGKQLRIRGANVLVLGDGETLDKLIKLAHQEGERYVISRGIRFTKLRENMPRGMCLQIQSDCNTVPEQIDFVCRHFNIICSEEDIFSRCTLCNCDKYLDINSSDMELLWTMKQSRLDHRSPQATELVPFIECKNGFVTEEGIMHTGVEIQMDGLTPRVLTNCSVFLVCSACGKVYWEGSHHRRAKNMVSDWIKNSDTTHDEQHVNEVMSENATTDSTSGVESCLNVKADDLVHYYVEDSSSEDELDNLVYY